MRTHYMIARAGARNNMLSVYLETLVLAADTESAANIPLATGKTGIVFNTATITCYYRRDKGSPVAVTLVAGTLGTFISGGFKEVDATNMPGLYEFCPPNAAFLKGTPYVDFIFKGITGVGEVHLHIDLIRALEK